MWTRRLGNSRRTGAVPVLIAVVMVAACDGVGPYGNSSADPDVGAAIGPIAEFFDWDWPGAGFGFTEPTEEDRQLHYQVEGLAAECMAERGFDYFPAPFWADVDASRGGVARDLASQSQEAADLWRLRHEDPAAYAREYGYGVTTIEILRDEDQDAGAVNPNHEYRDGLSPEAQEEYRRALFGFGTEPEVVGEPDSEDGSAVLAPGGCLATARQEVYGDEIPDPFSELREDIAAQLARDYSHDSRMVEVTGDWVRCMANAGHPGMEGLRDGRDGVVGRHLSLQHGETEEAGADPDRGAIPDPAARPEPDAAKLAALREFELEIAWADYQCREEHGVDAIERTVRFEAEAAFIEEHREELDAYRDWLNENDRLW
jgi:hypothetical protein